MKKLWVLIALMANVAAYAQQKLQVINVKEVGRIENVLAADEMRGRKPGTPEIDKAAAFISAEFKKAGLQPIKNSFFQEFIMVRPTLVSVKAEMDDVELDSKNVLVVTSSPDLKVNEKSGYVIQYFTTETIKNQAHFGRKARAVIASKKNTVVFIDAAFSQFFPRLAGLRRQLFKAEHSVIFILGMYKPGEFTVKAEQSINEMPLKNVVGMLPGKKKKDEYVIFSAHYDHIGVGRPENGDSIYNGANDDAAGTTAVMLLAKHFKTLNNNERTLLFVAFTAEETGGFGAQYFSQQLDPAKVIAMFNIEMIGTQSKWGKDAAYITGYEKSNMGEILQENLKGSGFSFYPDPYPEQQLFYRSDNATLARLGVPAHSISTSKMDDEPNYHKPSDEVKTLDLENMTRIIRSIARSAKTIIAGTDTPSRVTEVE